MENKLSNQYSFTNLMLFPSVLLTANKKMDMRKKANLSAIGTVVIIKLVIMFNKKPNLRDW